MRGRRSTSLRQAPRSPTYQLKRHLSAPEKLIKNPRKWFKTLLGIGIVLSFTLPVFRSGLKTNLTLWEFTINHTTFGDPVEFIPEEDYAAIFGKNKDKATNAASSETTGGIMSVVAKGNG